MELNNRTKQNKTDEEQGNKNKTKQLRHDRQSDASKCFSTCLVIQNVRRRRKHDN
jgi:hypothetical protein